MKTKQLLTGSVIAIAGLLLLTEPATYFIHQGLLNTYEASLLEPIFFFLIGFSVSLTILLFFTEKIFKLWVNKFAIWFIPLSVLVIASGSVGVSYGWPTRTSFALNLGVLIVIATLIFALVQRFYFKVR